MKLTKFEKNDYKNLKLDFKARGGFFYVYGPVTFAVMPNKMGKSHITWSICNNTDEFNKKRGKYKALLRYDIDVYLPLGYIPDRIDLENIAFNITDI